MSEEKSTKSFDVQGTVRSLVAALGIVAGVVTELHSYIDTKLAAMERSIVQQVGDVTYGHVLTMGDELRADLRETCCPQAEAEQPERNTRQRRRNN